MTFSMCLDTRYLYIRINAVSHSKKKRDCLGRFIPSSPQGHMGLPATGKSQPARTHDSRTPSPIQHCGCIGNLSSPIYREDMALVTRRFRASSCFLRSSAVLSPSSRAAMASLIVVSIFSFCPRLSFRDRVGSDTISSTRPM